MLTTAAQTALHFVASKKNMDVARHLLDAKPPASTRVRDRRGQFPIHRAAAVGSVPMTMLLLRNRSPINPTDDEGYTPLHHAVAEGHGAFPCGTRAARRRKTAMDRAHRTDAACRWPLGDLAVALLKEGADFGLKNSDGELALDLAPDKEVCCLRDPESHLSPRPAKQRGAANRCACTLCAGRSARASTCPRSRAATYR